MEQSFLPAEHYSMDSNRGEALQQQRHASKESGKPVQVTSLGPSSNAATGRGHNGGAVSCKFATISYFTMIFASLT